MERSGKREVIFASLLLGLVLLLLAPGAMAQCSICTKTASELGPEAAKGLNAGILYLAAIPLTLLGTIGFIWWKHNKNN